MLTVTGTPNPWSLRGCHPSATSADSPAAMDLLRHWVKECSTTHSRCRISVDPALPTRVLDLGSAASGTITLCETNGVTGRYICLSYCWGQTEFINTTRDTLKLHKQGIAIGNLPQTFQDTIHISRALGIRYVWIDSLCIIQQEKDHADWKRESGRMVDVYRNSYLTVAATGADSANGGCFATLESGVDIGPVKMRAIRHFPSTATIGSSTSFPLLTRAWAYQERLLAPRVIHFSGQELVWECREHRTCECGQTRYTRKQVNKSDFHDTISEFRWDKSRTPQQTWRQMVMQYSPLQLTYANDKLPAFSGLADEMRRNSNQNYLAGLWMDSLILDMCWHRPISENNQPSCEAVGRAPSWSWASVDGPVEYYDGLYAGGPDHEHGTRQYPEVIAAECSLAGPSLTGQVSHGSVEFRCCMVPASVQGNSIDIGMISNFTWYSDERCIIEKQGEYYFIPLARIGQYFCGIVVKPIHPGSETFIRIGFANMQNIFGLEIDDLGLIVEMVTGAKRVVRIV